MDEQTATFMMFMLFLAAFGAGWELQYWHRQRRKRRSQVRRWW